MTNWFVLQNLEQSLQVKVPEGTGEPADLLLLCSGKFLVCKSLSQEELQD